MGSAHQTLAYRISFVYSYTGTLQRFSKIIESGTLFRWHYA